jgi:hypothetical protein
VVVPLAEGPEFSPREIQLNAATFARRVPVMDDVMCVCVRVRMCLYLYL